jgi:hypothetical protein
VSVLGIAFIVAGAMLAGALLAYVLIVLYFIRGTRW